MTRAESTRIEATYTKKAKSQQSHSTAEMLMMSFSDLRANNRKGVTLQAIKKYIATKFGIDLRTDKRRYNILKSSLKALLNDGILVNLNSKGLVGHLRYVPPHTDAVGSKNRKSNAKPTKSGKRKSKDDSVQLSPVFSTQAMNTEPPPPVPLSIATNISETEGGVEPPVSRAPLRTRKSRTKAKPPTLHSMLTETPLSSRTQDTQTSEEREDGFSNDANSRRQPTTQPMELKRIPSKRRLFKPTN